jgi:WD40 repeat protein
LRIWDVATARVRRELQGPGGSIRYLAVSPDGSRIAATSDEPPVGLHLCVCDVASGAQLFSAVGAAWAYSPDGRWLATRDPDQTTVVLRDARTHQEVARFRGHEAPINSAVFSPDSRRLATCGEDRIIRVWDVAPLTLPSPPGEGGEGRVRGCQVLRGHTDEVFALAFHPDGTRLASGGRDRAVWLWDLARGEEVARLPGHTSYVWSVNFSRDGKTLVSGSGDFTVRLWDTEPLAKRYQARREAAALRPEAEQLVKRLFAEKKEADAVAAALYGDDSLSEPLRRAALRVLMRRANE